MQIRWLRSLGLAVVLAVIGTTTALSTTPSHEWPIEGAAKPIARVAGKAVTSKVRARTGEDRPTTASSRERGGRVAPTRQRATRFQPALGHRFDVVRHRGGVGKLQGSRRVVRLPAGQIAETPPAPATASPPLEGPVPPSSPQSDQNRSSGPPSMTGPLPARGPL